MSVLVGAVLMAGKFYAYRITGSSAILSDALESIINVVASAFALISILVSAKPPDESHPYGHGKVEYFSAGFEGALIILASAAVFKVGFDHLVHPRALPNLSVGLAIILTVGLVNLVLGASLVKVGRRTDSPALIADGRHVLADVYTSGGLLLGLFLAALTDRYWLDGAIACLVGVHILVSGVKLVRQSFAGLMDASSPELMGRIAAFLIEQRRPLWIDIHQLRAWRAGALIHMDLHLILPRDLSLEEAHREGKALERLLVEHFRGKASVLIHLDPCMDAECPVCARYACGLRAADFGAQHPWDRNSLVRQGPGARSS